MHGSLGDMEQQRIVDEFSRESSPLRVLITGRCCVREKVATLEEALDAVISHVG